MASKTVACPSCKQWVQMTPYGTRHRCVCGHVLTTRGAAAETQRETSVRGRGDHKGERHSFQRWQIAYTGTGTGTLMSLPSSCSDKPVCSGSRPNRRALLCGVTYKQHKCKLKGIYNDVKNMENLLTKTFGFPANCIRILSDDPRDLERIPTKKNIENSLKWLVEGYQQGDSLVFYFSGHGLRQPDFKDDELDGFDETICPVDFMEEGMILDNDINETIVWPLEEGVTLHAIVDACHSGTNLDLEHMYDRKLNAWKDNIPPSRARKSTRGGLAISLSACEDDKMAIDTTDFSGKVMNGAMTYLLTDTVRNKTDITYGVLLDEMVNYIKKINSERWTNSRFLRTVLRRKTIQVCFHFMQHVKSNGFDLHFFFFLHIGVPYVTCMLTTKLIQFLSKLIYQTVTSRL
ncbi:metacaspase-1-like isoform X2 [Pyrus x bretschneideri]|uniref:metacaspase-1-like isoform X2 n=1 Tax=Pyrus x bretschneideri TaxID=225117 RepID=UPI0020300780|nr:metacaspase-1-like isoform X2 [Pyrus x bretschneideri]